MNTRHEHRRHATADGDGDGVGDGNDDGGSEGGIGGESFRLVCLRVECGERRRRAKRWWERRGEQRHEARNGACR